MPTHYRPYKQGMLLNGDGRHFMSLDSDIYRSYSTMISSSYPEYLTRMGIDNIAEQAEGVYITDSNNKRYIDCTGGYGLWFVGFGRR